MLTHPTCILQCEGEEISWRHLISLYYRNNGSSHDQLSLVPKLKYEHVYLNSFSKMRVDLAAQVAPQAMLLLTT